MALAIAGLLPLHGALLKPRGELANRVNLEVRPDLDVFTAIPERHLWPVILCGGSGTRLWPLSRRSLPKQFLALTGESSLLETTLLRLGALRTTAPALCIAAKDMETRTRQTLDRSTIRTNLVLEPEARNTAPAIAAAAFVAHAEDSDAVLIVLPADHIIDNHQGFAAAAAIAVAAATVGEIIILGVRPTEPSSALGYIVPDAPLNGGVQRVARFIEKPDAARAAALIAAGALWNAGMVVARADTIIAALNLHEPRVSAAVRLAVDKAKRRDDCVLLDRDAFAGSPSISFDHAVLERHGHVRVVSLDAGWRDMGTWSEVAALIAPDSDANRIRGDVRLVGSRGNFLFSPRRLTVGLGIEDLVVIDTPDALLIAHQNQLGLLGETVKAMISEARPEALSYTETAAGGFAETNGDDRAVSTRIITLVPGECLQAESSYGRNLHWIVVAGEATVQAGTETSILRRNQSHFVAPGAGDRLENRGPGKLEIAEVRLLDFGAHE